MLLKNQLTQEECRKYFYYEDDILKWKVDTPKKKRVGSIVGYHKDKGYHQVIMYIEGKTKYYYLHVIIWNYFNGLIPDGYQIDHEKPLSEGGLNHIDNLRLVKSSVNNQNKKTRNVSGYTNITMSRNNSIRPWHVRLKQHGISKYFDNIEDAIEYRDSAREASGLLPAKDNNSY